MNMGVLIAIGVAIRRRMRTCTAELLAAAAVTASCAAFAQPRPAALDPEQQLLEQIAELRAEGGSTAAGLRERLHVLALLYQETEDHARASVAFDEARFITRVQEGLSSVDEALLLRQQIRSQDALGDHKAAWNLEQDMLTIARKHLDNVRMVPIFRDLAADRSQLLNDVRAGKYPPEMYLGCYYAGLRPRYDDARGERLPDVDTTGSCRFGTRESVILKLREEILLYYADAIEVLLENGAYASQELLDLERRALRAGFSAPYLTAPSTGNAMLGAARFVGVRVGCFGQSLDALLASDLLGSCLDPVVHTEGHVVANVGSWVSLVRLIAYEIRSAAPAAARANAFVELADWHLLAMPLDRRHLDDSTARALEVYERAYRELQLGADAATWTTQIFAPQIPVTLPADVPNPFASAAASGSSRYIDVAFDVTKYGRGEQIEIRATSRGATRAEERDLIRSIESTSFRPRVVGGKLADAAPVVLRYPLRP
jgi:hypothetical protein